MTALLHSRADAARAAAWRYLTLTPLLWPEFQRLMGEGVPAAALIWPDLPARESVVFHNNRPLFDFAVDGDEGAVSALIFLAYDKFSEPADLVAWDPQQEGIGAWFGAVALLGEESLWEPRLTKEGALSVFESPLVWLRDGRQGVIVIDPPRAAPLLRLSEPLAAESVEHGRRLDKLLTVRKPRILVPRPEVRRAARASSFPST
jgi:hypothetical protein